MMIKGRLQQVLVELENERDSETSTTRESSADVHLEIQEAWF